MCEYLINKGYKVFGFYRKSATDNKKNIESLISNKKIYEKKFFLIRGDLLDPNSIDNAILVSKPDEIYNFADQDNVGWSNQVPVYSFNVTAGSLINIFEILRKQKDTIKFFQPFTSNMFAWDKKKKQNENSLLSPSSIYALSKSSAYLAAKMYNKLYGLNICGAIYFNHESPRRNKEYVSQKIVRTACDIYLGEKN
jgi:GDPmannose 4,6-dehydratase